MSVTSDPLGNVTTYSYNKNEEPNSITDANDNSTAYEYNERGLLWKVTDANDGVTEYSYDDNGNLSYIEDANGDCNILDAAPICAFSVIVWQFKVTYCFLINISNQSSCSSKEIFVL